tara:strand:+ start:829 stop:1215 length:387 start_codon:yes stop_codon:yes gene_type:complete
MGNEKVVFGIYNADGLFLGELQYSILKVLGRASCNLCDTSHGWNPFGKRKWKRVCNSSDLDIHLIHRDEATASQLKAAGGLPSFITESEGNWIQIMSADQLSKFKNKPSELVAELEDLFEKSNEGLDC